MPPITPPDRTRRASRSRRSRHAEGAASGEPEATLGPVDPDVDLSDLAQTREASHATVLLAVAVGGGLGALARFGVETAFVPSTLPWGTLTVNGVGCLLIGVLMTLIVRAPRRRGRHAHPLLRPVAGVGFLGGFTTFSTAILQTLALTPGLAVAYTGLTLGVTLAAVATGIAVGALVSRRLWPRARR